MKIIFLTSSITFSLITSSAALADDGMVVQPVQVGAESLRYDQGAATLDLAGRLGSVQVRPIQFDHGRLVFSVAVYNGSNKPNNVDPSNFEVRAGDQSVGTLSVNDLQKQAKHRAMWKQIGVAAVGSIAAGLASSQRDTYSTTLYTPHWTYHATYSAPSLAGQLQADAIIAGSSVAIARIRAGLDETRRALGQEMLQLTTVNPGYSYGGKLVLDKIKEQGDVTRLTMIVHWNGEDYPFAFQIARQGTPTPQFVMKEASAPVPLTQPQPLSNSIVPPAAMRTISPSAPALSLQQAGSIPLGGKPMGFRFVPSADGASIVAVLPNSFADKAGLRVGQTIETIGSHPLKGLQPAAMVATVRSETATRVTLAITGGGTVVINRD